VVWEHTAAAAADPMSAAANQSTVCITEPAETTRMSTEFKLSSGASIPAIGLGLWKIDRDITASIVRDAIEIGYRHIDAACDYGNESEAGDGIGQAIGSGLVRREDLWVTSKLWNTYHRPEHVRAACEKTLADLKLDYLDLYHIHFPISLAFVPFETRYPPGWFFDPDAEQPRMAEDPVPILETWQAMVELQQAGLVRHLGVCNFGVSLIRDLMAASTVKPEVLQVELHPYLTQEKLLRFCGDYGIHVTGFSPLGAQSYFSIGMAEAGEGVLDREETRRIAAQVGKTPAQVLLRWGVQRGTSVVPKTSRKERLVENLQVFDFELSDEQMAMLSGLDQHRRFNDPGDFGEKAFNTFMPIYE
jgi:D-xylose reductase